MRTKGSHGQWLNPWKVCPDAKESKVHHGRYWSNVACNNDFTRNKGKRSAKTTWNMMEKLGELLK